MELTQRGDRHLSPAGRARQGRGAASTLVILALALCLVACSRDDTPLASGLRTTTSASASSASEPPADCLYPGTDYEAWCHVVEAAGTRARYLMFRATPATSKTIIYDAGGPGLSNLSRLDLSYKDYVAAANARHYNVVVVDEPWVIAPYTSACKSALSSFYSDSIAEYTHQASTKAGRRVRDECLSSGSKAALTAASYRAMVDEIERVEKIEIVRFEGHSFASVRAAYLGSSRPNLVVAIGSPFPVGGSAADFYAAIASGASKSGDASPHGLEADSAKAYYQSTGASPDDVDKVSAGRALWQVNSDGLISLSRVGYYSEICNALTSWKNLGTTGRQGGAILSAFASLHSVCNVENGESGLKLPSKTCFRVLQHDTSTPWIPSPLTRGARVTVVTSGQHGKIGIPSCP